MPGEMTSPSASVQLDGEHYLLVLEVDPDLAAAVPPDQLELARKRLLAQTLTADSGPWDQGESDPTWLGLLVVEGLLTRDVEIAGTRSRELLGAGDIMRPWDDDSELSPVRMAVSWTILEPIRLAVLDRRFMLLASRWPELADEIIHRVLRRSRWLAVRLAVGNLRGVPDRIMLLFWHLASNWGRVTPQGTIVPLALTHETIAELVGARRPSITTAISELRRAGDLEPVEEGWLLRGDPPSGSIT
jgi:CRP/FNR family transcriptional regulator, cyclic AMP receptor protein